MEYKKYMVKKSFFNDNIFLSHFIFIAALQIMVVKFEGVLGETLFVIMEFFLILRIIWQYKLIIEYNDLIDNGCVFFLDFEEVNCKIKKIFFHGKYSYSLTVKTNDNKIKSEMALLLDEDIDVMYNELKNKPIPIIRGIDGRGYFMLDEVLQRYEDEHGRSMNQGTQNMLDKINKETFLIWVIFRYIMLFIMTT